MNSNTVLQDVTNHTVLTKNSSFRTTIHNKFKKVRFSIIIPCFNEEATIEKCVKRTKKAQPHADIIIINDGSTDNTTTKVIQLQKKIKNLKLISYPTNKGKGWAVKVGFDSAKGEVLAILDADMSVPPEELMYFYETIISNKADFVNGTRMVYQKEKQSMRLLHLLGNKFFSLLFSFILDQKVTDTLCGTKALLKRDYQQMKMGTEPWGDFDLLFNAARLGLRIKEIPVHYKKRLAGKSKMQTFKHGFILIKMALKGLMDLKIKKLTYKTLLLTKSVYLLILYHWKTIQKEK